MDLEHLLVAHRSEIEGIRLGGFLRLRPGARSTSKEQDQSCDERAHGTHVGTS